MMETRQKVLFYGDSLVLAAVQASLKASPWLEVTSLDEATTEAELLAPGTSVIIFDLGAAGSEFALAQMQAQPGLLLVGIDPESHEVLLTGQAARTITAEQIAQLVRSREMGPAPPACTGV